jgi:Mce-associated membrane protein
MADEEVVDAGVDDAVGDGVDDAVEGGPAEESTVAPTGLRRRRKSGLPPLGIAAVVGLVLAVVLGGLCGWLGFQAYQARQDDQLRQLFVDTAKQGAVNLTTIDYAHAEGDVKRILDMATGAFREEFSSRSGPFVDVVQKAQSKSVGTVTEAGLESVTEDEGQVLVAVTVSSTSVDAATQPPRYWRMRLTIRAVDGTAKVAKVDFVP